MLKKSHLVILTCALERVIPKQEKVSEQDTTAIQPKTKQLQDIGHVRLGKLTQVIGID